ncbi:hypothetical protein ACVWW1_001265 [Bradyrhizobium sp. JR3.5]
MPGFLLFEAASAVVELVSLGPHAPVTLLTSIAANGATAFLVILAMTFGLILPRMLLEHFLTPDCLSAAGTSRYRSRMERVSNTCSSKPLPHVRVARQNSDAASGAGLSAATKSQRTDARASRSCLELRQSRSEGATLSRSGTARQRSPIPYNRNFLVVHLRSSKAAPHSEDMRTLAVVRISLISRRTRRAHTAF